MLNSAYSAAGVRLPPMGIIRNDQPFGSMPSLSSSLRPNVLSQLARLIPAFEAANSNCAFSSGVIRILNCGDCPSPLVLLSRLIVDKWSPIKLISLVIGGHLITVKPIKTTPPKGATNTRRGLTTNVIESSEVAMHNTITPQTGAGLSHPKYQYRFMVLDRADLQARPCQIIIEATSERGARKTLAPHYILSLAAVLPVQEVRHA